MTRYADPSRCPDCRSPIVAGAAACGACGLPLHGATAQQLFGGRSPVGQVLSISGVQLTVVGELNTAGSTVGGDQDDQVVIPATTFANDFSSGGTSVSSIYLQAASQQDLSAAYQETLS